jgi:hypothetical protein
LPSQRPTTTRAANLSLKLSGPARKHLRVRNKSKEVAHMAAKKKAAKKTAKKKAAKKR